jgi:polar amino acid transport system substrate-binding protein
MAFQILIVEDSPTQALKLELLLNDNRYLTHVAKNGQDGIGLATDKSPDLIISDVTMPVMSGFVMCSHIKNNPETRHIPVLLLTDLHDPEDIINGLNAKADAYVTKPYKESFLLSKVAFLLTNQHLTENVSNEDSDKPLTINFFGKSHTITAGRDQVLNLLMSTYENSLLQNTELKEKQMTLNLLNEELKKNNSALAASEDRFRSLVLTIPDIVYRIDANGYFTFINNAIRRLGYEKEELIGKHFSEIICSEDIDDVSREKVLSKIPKNVHRPPPKLFDERRSGSRITTGLEVRLKSKSGEKLSAGEIESLSDDFIVVEVNSAGITGIHSQSEEKEYVGTVGVIRDISERKKAEAALERERMFLQTVVDSVPLPVFFKTIHDEYQLTNTAFCDFVDKKFSEIIGYGLFDFLPAQVAEIFHFKEQLFLSSDDSRQVYEMEMRMPEQPLKNVVCHIAKFFNTDQSLQGLIGVIVDVTSQKQIEFELQKSRIAAEQLARRADEANRLKSNFLANMSHEIRTPMNAIIGLNSLALKTNLTDRQKDYLVKIDQSAQSLLGILNDILDFSKIEAHKLDLESVPFDLFEVLENLTNMFCMKQDEKQIEIFFSVDQDVPNLLVGDPLRLGQILINLLSNAIKFTDRGDIIISISVQKQRNENVTLAFSVKDAGIGMTEDQVNRLFQPFSQADTSTTRKYGGTGLGLTICKRLVEMMDGKIQAASVYGEGSTFSFTSKFQMDSQKNQSRRPMDLTGKKAVVIDDNETCRNILYYLLTHLNMKVTLFSCEKEYVQWLNTVDNEKQMDLILIDHGMPDTDSLCLARQIKKELILNSPPIILMDTIYGRESVLDDAAQKIISHVIVKPIPPSILYQTVSNIFQPDICVSDGSHKQKSDEKASACDFHEQTILLVEDNIINQQVAYEILTQKGLCVNIADNGSKAIEMIKEKLDKDALMYDAILMDIQMPEMDGYETTRAINALYNESNRAFPIIAMTAHAMSGDKERCIQAGMDDYISKPIQPKQLFNVLSQWLTKSRQIVVSQPREKSEPCMNPMEMAIKQLEHINIEEGTKRLGGRLKLFNNILQEFCLSHKDYPSMIMAAIQAESFTKVHEISHTIKGVAGNLSADGLLDAAQEIEKHALKQDKRACLNQLSEVEKAFNNVVRDAQLLKQILKNCACEKALPEKTSFKNKNELESVLRNFYQSLINHNMTATIHFENINQRITDKVINPYMKKISAAIDQLDFEQAKTILIQMADILNVQLEKHND